MRYLLVVVVAALLGAVGAVGAISAGSSQAAPPVRVEDNCACGGSWPQLYGQAYGYCTWDYGPGSSPRFVTRPC
jgi:hypothetical protein